MPVETRIHIIIIVFVFDFKSNAILTKKSITLKHSKILNVEAYLKIVSDVNLTLKRLYLKAARTLERQLHTLIPYILDSVPTDFSKS